MPASWYVDENGSVAMPEVNLRECVTYLPPSNVNKAAHSGFETQRRCSKQGYQLPHKKELYPQFFLKKSDILPLSLLKKLFWPFKISPLKFLPQLKIFSPSKCFTSNFLPPPNKVTKHFCCLHKVFSTSLNKFYCPPPKKFLPFP